MPIVQRPQSENELNLTAETALQFDPSEIHYAWVRWIIGSVNKHFMDLRDGYELYLEGDERTLSEEAEFAELRMDGPFILIPQKGLYYLDVEVNILLQAHPAPRELYNIHRIIGIFSRAFTNTIPIYAYGDEPIDNGALIECLHLQRSLRESVNINNYGIIKEDTRLMQATIEGHYRLEIWKLRS